MAEEILKEKILEKMVYRFDCTATFERNTQILAEFATELMNQINSYKAKGRIFAENGLDHPVRWTVKRYPVKVKNPEGVIVRLDRMTFKFEISTDWGTNSELLEHMQQFFKSLQSDTPVSQRAAEDDWLLTRFYPVVLDD